MPTFVATINRPGYLPDTDEPQEFDTPTEAWSYLKDEYVASWENVPLPAGWTEDRLPESLDILFNYGLDAFNAQEFSDTGYFWLPTPGKHENDPHDMGFNYSVVVGY